jgi:hypothetical protein
VAECRRCLDALQDIGQILTVESIISRPPLRPADREYYAEGLRLAGVID